MDGFLWGSRACSIGEIGGLITLQHIRDVYAGETINLALAFACACACTGSNHVAPATRDDGKGGKWALSRALQRYGMLCVDSTAGSG